MSLSNFLVFFISALSHFPSAKFTHTHFARASNQSQRYLVPSMDWCKWIWQTDLTLLRGFFGQNPPSVFPSLLSLFARKFIASFLLSKVCSLELKPGKKIAGNYKSLFMDFYFLPASPFLLMKRPHLMLIFSCPQPFWHLHYFCRSFFGLLDK